MIMVAIFMEILNGPILTKTFFTYHINFHIITNTGIDTIGIDRMQSTSNRVKFHHLKTSWNSCWS